MKTFILSACISGLLIFSSCSGTKEKTTGVDTLSSVVIPDTSKKPERKMNSNLNVVDENGKRQGHWKIYGKMQDDKSYTDLSVKEEGDYKDDLKEGEWTEYTADGKVKRTVNYHEGKEAK